MVRTSEGRLAYADLLRVAAMMAVIVLHVSGGWLSAASVGTPDWHVLSALNGLTRWCVPVFVMLSGMFLLDPKKGLSWRTLFFRYVLRMVVALAVWGVVYTLFDHVLFGGTLNAAVVRELLERLVRGQVKIHLWYIPMTIGLYLITPVLRAFVRGGSRGDLHWFFALWAAFAVVLPFVMRLRPSDLTAFWLGQLQLHLIVGYVGYYVAGYYLKAYTLSRTAEWLIYLGGIAGAVLTVGGTYWRSAAAGQLDELYFSYFAPGVVLLSVAVVVFCRYVLGISEERSRRQRAGRVAEVSFGVYLVHLIYLNLLQKLMAELSLPAPPFTPLLAVPLLALCVFIPSYLTVWLLHKIPVVGRYLT